VKGAGLEHRTPYALRHTFASFAIAAGVPLFELSRFMGASVEQIGRTYGHLAAGFARQGANGAGYLPRRACRGEGGTAMSGVCARSVPTSTATVPRVVQRRAAPHAARPLVGAPGFEPGTSSPPGCFSRVAGDGPRGVWGSLL
jgi:hypothetical protein